MRAILIESQGAAAQVVEASEEALLDGAVQLDVL